MNRIINILLLGLMFFLSVCTAAAQTPAPTPLDTGWTVSLNGGYSQVQNAGTNNGFFFSTAFRLSKHFAARGDVFVLNDPAITITLAKPELRFSPFSKSSSPVAKTAELFFNAGAGDARFTDPAKGTKSKFAWGVGGGFDLKIACGNVVCTIRPLDATYLRSSLLAVNGGAPAQVLGNHLQFAAGLGLRF